MIEDEAGMVELLFTMVNSRETKLLLALNGFEALELLRKEPVDAVLTDIRMPEMTGIELVQKMRKEGFATPVVMMSGFADLKIMMDAMKAGVLEFIEKPFKRDEMMSTIQHALILGESVRVIHANLQKVYQGPLDEKGHDMLRYLSVFLAQQELDRRKTSQAS